MKKFLLLSVMAAAAFSASAYDTFAPGTDAEHPNYYLIRTNRGNSNGVYYLSYSVEELANGDKPTTHLHRSSTADEYSLWAVSPGAESNTLNVKNFKAEDAYLMTFSGGTADVSSTPVDLYLVTNEDKSFSIGTGTSGSVFLDANNWNDNCGNWVSGDAGTTWFATLVDLTNGDDVVKAIQYALYSSEYSAAKTSAVAQLQGYAAVDVVADIITAGIEAINAVEVSADAANQINNILSSTLSNANAFLTTDLAGKTFGLHSLRRAGGDYAYVSTNIAEGKYLGVINLVDGNTLFEFKAIDGGGYHLYNKSTDTYIGPKDAGYMTTFAPTADESEAVSVFPFLNSQMGLTGISFALKAERSSYEVGFNFDGGNGAMVGYYVDYDADGSIWDLVVFDEEAIVKEVTEAYINHLTEYAANVEPAAEIFTESISKIEALTYSATLGEEAAAIETAAIAAANEFLKVGLNNKSVQVRSLRNGYVVPGAEWYAIAAEPSDASNYDFASVEDGGYTLFNATNDRYLGPWAQNGGNISMTQVAGATDAQAVYPQIGQSGNFYGVAFPLHLTEQGMENYGLNTNNTGLHTYGIGDAGSIFAIKVMGPATEINEITVANAAAEGIYDLAGRRLSAPVRGINIINGRKVLVK